MKLKRSGSTTYYVEDSKADDWIGNNDTDLLEAKNGSIGGL